MNFHSPHFSRNQCSQKPVQWTQKICLPHSLLLPGNLTFTILDMALRNDSFHHYLINAGTSTDVSRYAGDFEHVFESNTAGVTIQAPQVSNLPTSLSSSVCTDGQRRKKSWIFGNRHRDTHWNSDIILNNVNLCVTEINNRDKGVGWETSRDRSTMSNYIERI